MSYQYIKHHLPVCWTVYIYISSQLLDKIQKLLSLKFHTNLCIFIIVHIIFLLNVGVWKRTEESLCHLFWNGFVSKDGCTRSLQVIGHQHFSSTIYSCHLSPRFRNSANTINHAPLLPTYLDQFITTFFFFFVVINETLFCTIKYLITSMGRIVSFFIYLYTWTMDLVWSTATKKVNCETVHDWNWKVHRSNIR